MSNQLSAQNPKVEKAYLALGDGAWVGDAWVVKDCPICGEQYSFHFIGLTGLWKCNSCDATGDYDKLKHIAKDDLFLMGKLAEMINPTAPEGLIQIGAYMPPKRLFVCGTGYKTLDEQMGGLYEGEVTIVSGKRASGKCFGKGTKIVMFDGTLKNVEDILIGDQVMGIDSKPRNVLALSSGVGNMYRVRQTKGIDYVVTVNHVLCLKHKDANKKGFVEDVEISVEKYLKQNKTWKSLAYGYRKGVEFEERIILIDPYFLGVWLGDGTADSIAITTADKEVVKYFTNYAESISHFVKIKSDKGKAKTYQISGHAYADDVVEEYAKVKAKINKYGWSRTISTSGFSRETGVSTSTLDVWSKKKYFQKLVSHYELNPEEINTDFIKERKIKGKLIEWFSEYGLMRNKHIPDDYLYNSRSVRLKLLAGILDADAFLYGNCYDIVQKNKTLAYQIKYLANSLGLRCSIAETRKKCCNNGVWGTYYRMSISGDIQSIPVIVERRKPFIKPRINEWETKIRVEPEGIGEYFGFEVDGDHKFFLEDFTVTHNSTITGEIALNAVEQGAKVCFYSGELNAGMFQNWILSQAAGERYMEAYTDRFGVTRFYPCEYAVARIKTWLLNKFVLYDNSIKKSSERNAILERFQQAKKYFGCTLFFVDNLMTARYTKDGERDYYRQQSNFVGELVDFAHQENCHVILVAHPKKGDTGDDNENVAGLSDITNRASNVLTVYRQTPKEKFENGMDTILTLSKNRNYGALAKIGFNFDATSRRLIPADGEYVDRYGWEDL